MKKLLFYILFFTFSLSLFAEEKYDWLIKNNWSLESLLFNLNEPCRVYFRKLEILPGITMYQQRLRKDRFMLQYQTDKKDKLYVLEMSYVNGYYDMVFGNNYTSLSLTMNGTPHGTQERVGKQENKNFPLVGIWGKLPYLTEYRIVDPKDCFIYMEITDQYPYWAIREGTYLLKQIDEKTFETVSSFPDGRLRLTVNNEKQIVLTPLFTLPDDEKGSVGSLLICRFPYN